MEDPLNYRLDMTMMYTIHDAFRRDLQEIVTFIAPADDTQRLQSEPGWQLFKKYLTVHHQTEDDVLWPALRARLKDFPHFLLLIDELENEHSAIDPLLRAVERSANEREGGESFIEVVRELATRLTAHLAHEESDGLALIDVFLSPEEWQRFAQVHGERLIADAPTYMPWLLDGAELSRVENFLGKIPPPLASAYREQWAADYAALNRWDSTRESLRTSVVED
jgi:hemerythrin